jgi:thioesterase domain-containing protein
MPEEWVSMLESFFAAQSAYEPRPYPGKVALFRARARPLFRLWDADLGWSQIAMGGVEVHTITGSHDNMMQEPNVKWLAEALRRSLDEAERAALHRS